MFDDDDPEVRSDGLSLRIQLEHLFGKGARRDVEIFRLDAEKFVTDASTRQVGDMACLLEV